MVNAAPHFGLSITNETILEKIFHGSLFVRNLRNNRSSPFLFGKVDSWGR